jgi:uncharacterized protein (TIGR02118 family)
MVKLTFCVRRLASLSDAEFHRYWLQEHGPLVLQHAEALRIRRYVQTHALPGAVNDALRTSRGTAAPFDGIAEAWWDDLEDLDAALGSEAGRRASAVLLEDERRFIDLAGSALWLNEEHVLLGGTNG